MRLLLVEDDRMLGETLARNLTRSGHAVDWIRDGNSASEALSVAPYDLVILDLGLPGRDGHEVLQSMRSAGNRSQVLILTARDAVSERVRGLDGGADDYLLKPFDFEELLARLRALARRRQDGASPALQHLNIRLDPASRQVQHDGQPVDLTRREFAVLQAMMEQPNQVWTRERLIDRLYGFENGIASNSLEVHVYGLRRKLSADLIVSVRGVGYILKSA